MAYFTAIKITDANGNVVELLDVTPLLEEIRDELKAIHKVLEEDSGIEIDTKEVTNEQH